MINLTNLKAFFIGYGAFIIFDLLWLGVIMHSFYTHYFAQYTRLTNGFSPHWPTALLVWALLVIGLLVLVIPQVNQSSIWQQFLLGAFYGLIIYGVYQGTNYAIFPNWSYVLVIVDTAWGILVNGLVTIIICYFY